MPRLRSIFEIFSLYHALSTFLIVSLAFALSRFFPGNQSYWLLLSSVLLSQAGLRAELSWRAFWQPLYYFICALMAAVLVFILSVASPYFAISLTLLALTTFISNYLGWLNRRYFFAAFFINLLAIIAVFSPTAHLSAGFSPGGFLWGKGVGEAEAFQRFYLVLLAGLIVFFVRLPFFLYQRSRQARYAWAIFLQKLKNMYRLIFVVFEEEDEARFQAAWCDCLSALETFKRMTAADAHLESIWDLSLSLGALRYRVSDKSVLTMAQSELKDIFIALSATLNQCANYSHLNAGVTVDIQPLEIAIQRFEDLYQNTLQTVTPEPLVLLLFIQDLHALKEALETLLPQAKKDRPHPLKKSSSSAATFPSFFSLHRALRSSMAVVFALFLGQYYFPAQCFWMVIAASLLTQTEMGLPLHQILGRALWFVMVVLLSAQILIVLSDNELPVLLIVIMTVMSYWYAYTSRRYLSLHFPLLMMIVSLLAILAPAVSPPVMDVLGVVIGAFLAIVSTLIIFPDKPDLEFGSRVLPLVDNLSIYWRELIDLLLQKKQLPLQDKARSTLEYLWGNRDECFPVWVFEPGYNPALRAGQYYFVIHLGQISEILFAINHLARHAFEADSLSAMENAIQACAVRTEELFQTLTALLKGEKLKLNPADYLDDVTVLEESFREASQPSLELLDLSRDNMYLAAFIRYLKDLRLQLLQLVSTFKE